MDFLKQPVVTDADVEDDLMALMIEMGKVPAPAAKKEAPAPQKGKKRELTPEEYAQLMQNMNEAEKLLAGDISMNIDDVDLGDLGNELEALGIDLDDPELQDMKDEKKHAPVKGALKISEMPDLEDEMLDDITDEPTIEKKRPRPSSKKNEEKKSAVIPTFTKAPPKNLTYEELFDYFAGNFLNFLEVSNDPELSNEYLQRLTDLAPMVFAGEQEEIEPVQMYTLPKALPPFAHWSNIRERDVNIKSISTPDINVKNVLNESRQTLNAIQKRANECRDAKSVAEIEKAMRIVNKSEHNMPKPAFFVPTYVEVTESNELPNVNASEVVVKLISVRNIKVPKNNKMIVQLSPCPRVQFTITESTMSPNRALSIPGFDPKTVLRPWSKPDSGKITIDADTRSFSLAPLFNSSSAIFEVAIGNGSVKLEISIRQPLGGVKTSKRLIKYMASPLVVNGADEEEVVTEVPAKPKTAAPAKAATQKGVPAPARASVPAPAPTRASVPVAAPSPAPVRAKAATQNIAPAPKPLKKVWILSEEEKKLFWPEKVMELYVQQALILVPEYKQRGEPTAQLQAQGQFFKRACDEFTKKGENQEIDPMEYLANAKKALIREKRRLKTVTNPEELEHVKLVCAVMEQEINEINEMISAQ